MDTDDDEVAEVKKGLREEFSRVFGRTNSINKLGTQFGVYAGSSDGDMTPYITWGMFEDYLINGYLGFGNGFKDINNGKDFQVRMDSSDSYTSWSYIHRIVFQQRLQDLTKQPTAFNENGDILLMVKMHLAHQRSINHIRIEIKNTQTIVYLNN